VNPTCEPIKDYIETQHCRQQHGIEEVSGNKKATEFGEKPQQTNFNLLDQKILSSLAFVNQTELEKFVKVMSGDAWAGKA